MKYRYQLAPHDVKTFLQSSFEVWGVGIDSDASDFEKKVIEEAMREKDAAAALGDAIRCVVRTSYFDRPRCTSNQLIPQPLLPEENELMY